MTGLCCQSLLALVFVDVLGASEASVLRLTTSTQDSLMDYDHLGFTNEAASQRLSRGATSLTF